MRKILLFSAAVSIAVSAWGAGQIRTVAPDLAVTHISPNGRYVVSQIQGYVEIFDLETGTKSDYYGDYDAGEDYTFGMGNAMSDRGIGVGSTTVNGNACVWENGEWISLPVMHPEMTNMSQGITPDASRICGQVGNAPMGTDSDDIISVPCIWERGEDGTYRGPILLPHPDKDLTGRTPQYITAIAISDDGRTIAGQIRDYSGMMVQPILYRQNEEGEWNYKVLFPELANPDGIVLPEFPGEAPQDAPDMRNFMSASEQSAYDEAMAKWEAEGGSDWSTYPDMEDFMTQAELNDFNKAVEDYYSRVEEWQEKYQPFKEALDRLMETATVYLFNNVYLSPDGKRYATTTIESVPDESAWGGFSDFDHPVLMDLEKMEFKTLESSESMMVSGVTADYSVLANTDGLRTPKQAYISLRGEGDWTLLNTWLDRVDPEVGEWFTENTSHDVETINSDGVLEVLENYVCSGVAVCTPDMSLFATYAEILWEGSEANFTESYIFSISQPDGVQNIENEGEQVISVNYYSVDGKRLSKAPSDGLAIRITTLDNGTIRSEKVLY